MTTAQQVLDIARSQIGVKEEPAGSNHVLYNDWYWGPGAGGAWCGAEVSWIFDKAGLALPATTAKGFASCAAGAHWFKALGRWRSRDDKPEVGDVVFFDWGQGIHHVGIVEVPVAARDLYSIEGNTDSAGGRTGGRCMRQHRKTSLIAGYGIPAYDAPAEVPAPTPDSPADGRPALHLGVQGPAVRWWQALLNNNANGKLHPDGDFGRETRNATCRFQAALGLTQDGVVGPRTWGAMDLAASGYGRK